MALVQERPQTEGVLYEIVCESIPNTLINFTREPVQLFNKITFDDSIFDFFPYANFNFKDETGTILDAVNFSEALEFIVKVGNSSDGYVGHNYVWNINEFNNVTITENFSGDNLFIFISKYFLKNHKKSKSYIGTANSVATQIANTIFSITDVTKLKISPTVGADTFYQGDIKSSEFLKDLANIAQNPSYANSPFFTFINTNGEFYFMSFADMMMQPEVNLLNPYTLGYNYKNSTDPYKIKDYVIQHGGMEWNFDNYNIQTYEWLPTGIEKILLNPISTFVHRDGTNKFLIKNTDVIDISDTLNVGITESQDIPLHKAKINSFFRNVVTSYRIEIVVQFNPLAVCGKPVLLDFDSAFDKKIKLKEFSGKWLILKSTHFMDYEGEPYSRLYLGRSSMYVDSRHPFYGLYI